MAISNLLPRKTMGSKSLSVTLHDRIDYDENPKKTQDGELVSSYQCSPESAAEEYLISKQLYEALSGRSQPKGRDIIMYRIIRSFTPGEIRPEEANRIGYELAMAFTKGRQRFVVFTHMDKKPIHTRKNSLSSTPLSLRFTVKFTMDTVTWKWSIAALSWIEKTIRRCPLTRTTTGSSKPLRRGRIKCAS